MHRKLRVGICHPDLGLGGAERLIVDAAVELTERGHSVHVFTAHHDRERCFGETVDGSFPVTVYGDFLPRHILHRLHAVCAYVRCLFVAACMVLLWPPFDVVIADQVSAVIPVLRLSRKTKVLFYCHFPDLLLAKHTSRLRRLYRAPIDWLEEVTTGSADKVVVNSEFTAATFAATFGTLAARGVRPAVLYPAVRLGPGAEPPGGPAASDPAIAGISGKSRFFLSINRFERKKNVELAIRAWALLQQRQRGYRGHGGDGGGNGGGPTASAPVPDGTQRLPEAAPEPRLGAEEVRLVLAGGYDVRLTENREYLKELECLAEEEGVAGTAVFVPSFTDAQKAALLAGCICVLYTPENEHFGIVPLEAMAAWRPVIACNSGGPRESVQHNITGFLCEPTPESFAAAMGVLLAAPDRAEEMGRAARRHVEGNFSCRAFGENLDGVLQDLVGR